MKIVKEFQEFAAKGNAFDLAVGVVVGAAFSKIITSLVNDIVMPPLGLLLSGRDFIRLQVVLKPARIDQATQQVLEPAVAIRYGCFINTVLDFLIVAVALFATIKLINAARRRLGGRLLH